MLSGLVACLIVAAPALAADLVTKHSGTVMALDKAASRLVLAEVGPWQLRGGETVLTRRTIAVTSTTEFSRAARTEGPGPGGWIGEFVEKAAHGWTVKEGDFVTVTAQRNGAGLTAVKVCVSEIGP